MAKPVLKWAGGKRQLLDAIYARFPASYGRYHEPFVGGGAVFFDLEPAVATVNDANPRLVNFYEQVRERPDELVARLREFRAPDTDPDPALAFADEDWKEKSVDAYYYQQRARFNRRAYDADWPERADAAGDDADWPERADAAGDDADWPERVDAAGDDADDGASDHGHGDGESDAVADPYLEEAALLLYLNRTCYNGLYRENADGGFNVPIGRYADPDWVQAERVRAASRVLAEAEVRNVDFETALSDAEAGDLVYCDPPYEPMSATADFAEYSAGGFDRDDQERLLATLRDLDERGVWVVVSNSGVTYDRYADAGFRVERVQATRAINSDETSRDAVDEIVATNVPESERGDRGQAELDEFE